MTDLRTAAQQALNALEEATNYTGCEAWSPSMTDECLAAAAALRAALAQQEQEPVAWWKRHGDGSVEVNEAKTFIAEDALATGRRPLVFGDAIPPLREWVGLTEEEIENLWWKWVGTQRANYSFTRAIEQALKEKNHE